VKFVIDTILSGSFRLDIYTINRKASPEVLLRGGRELYYRASFLAFGLVFLFLLGRFLLCWHVSSVNDFP